jgi:quinol monooxygenase YgiN
MSVTRVNQFHARAGQEEALRGRLQAIVSGLRATTGCEACSLLQDVAEPAVFVVIEVWESREAHQAAVQAIAPEELQAFMSILAEPPRGGYLEADSPRAGDENA